MKRIATILLVLMGWVAMAQGQLNVAGMVFENSPMGQPVPNQSITIDVYANGALFVSHLVETDESGFYEDSIQVNVGQGEVILSTMDCDNSTLSYSHPFFGDSLFVFQEFLICGDTMTGCLAYFDYEIQEPLTVGFINMSIGGNFNYFWDFGDGQTSQEENPVHVYAQNGFYEVLLSIVDSAEGCSSIFSGLVMLNDSTGGSCQASFQYATDPVSPQTITFVNVSQGNPTFYGWDFGDGTFSNDENPTHTYQESGFYTICLTIMSNDSTCYDVFCENILLGNDTLGCQAEFFYYAAMDTLNPSGNPLTLQFVDVSFGNPGSWYWQFGDGTASSEQNPIHTYAAPGLYDVCLTIEGADSSCFSTSCQNIVVQNDTATCIAQYVYFPDSSQNDFSVQFVDLSYGNVTNWYWDFGDGSDSFDQNPTHTFAEEGLYYVCLTINGPDCQSTWCEEVWVGTITECYNYFTYQTVENSLLFNGFHSSDIPASYVWDFGDGTTEMGQEVTHVYSGPGMYYVTLLTSDDNMCEAISTQMVVVGDSIIYNQVYGQVFEGSFPLSEGFVMIYSLDTSGNYLPFFDLTMIDSTGVYVFPYVPNGEFLIYAVSMDYNGYLPTYFGDVINWEEATPVVLGQPNNPYDIHLVEATVTAPAGNGNITGVISNGRVSSSFMDKIEMLLFNEQQDAIGYTSVNADGAFALNNLANGVYYLYPELSGVDAQKMRVEITEQQQNVQVNMTFANGSILGIENPLAIVVAGDIYPNPVGEVLNLALSFQRNSDINIRVLGLDGRTYLTTQMKVNAGIESLKLNVQNLPKGMFILQISDSNQTTLHRKFIK